MCNIMYACKNYTIQVMYDDEGLCQESGNVEIAEFSAKLLLHILEIISLKSEK